MVIINDKKSTTSEEEDERVKKIITDQRLKQDSFAPRDLTLLYFSNWYIYLK